MLIRMARPQRMGMARLAKAVSKTVLIGSVAAGVLSYQHISERDGVMSGPIRICDASEWTQ